MSHTAHSSDKDSHGQRFVTADDCFIPPGNEHILILTSDKISTGDVSLALGGRYISGGLAIALSLVRFHDGRAVVTAVNPTSLPVTLFQGTSVACFTDTEPLSFVPLHVDGASFSTSSDDDATMAALKATINPDPTSVQKQEVLGILQKQSASFDVNSKLLGRTSVTVHRIETERITIVRRRPYLVSSAERRIIENNVADMLKRDVIRPSSSSW